MPDRAQSLIESYLYPSDTSRIGNSFHKRCVIGIHHHNKVERDGHRNATLYRVRPSVCNPIQGQSKHVATLHPSMISVKQAKIAVVQLQEEETNFDIRYLFIVEKGLVPCIPSPPISQ